MRRRLPETRKSITHKFKVGTQKGYLNVGLFDDGSVGEIFVKLDKSAHNGWTNTIGVTASLALQHGVPLESIVNKWVFQRFDPSGPTANPEIPMANSIVDYLGRWLGHKFIPGFGKE